ncbi:M50 family metallopeptidase [Aneurinibacillus tyrosinisolvens]|uniref:M50 family metallopeptidase n=1 Tax=Aneurinibacillus tyrosinisolvens TaxID=1443435 RepID=UPI00063F3876|nr:M50 family metallopeptidase [Aneurinibacillus tyrosinisolvens]
MKHLLFRPLPVYVIVILALTLIAFYVPEKREKMIRILLMVLSALLAHIIHELGHTLFGLAAGLRFIEYTVGFFTVDASTGKLRFLENKQWKNMGGLVKFVPTSMSIQETMKQWKMLVIGGPLTSLAFGLVALNFSRLPVATHLDFFLFMAGLLNLGIGILTLIPNRGGTYYSDGSILRLLQQGGTRSEQYLHFILLSPHIYTAAPPSQWPIALIRQAENSLSASPGFDSQSDVLLEAQLRMQLYYFYIDRGDLEHAAGLLLPIVYRPRDQHKYRIELQNIDSFYITHHFVFGNEPNDLDVVADRISPKEPYSYNKTQAIRLARQGKYAEAGNALNKADQMYESWFKPFGFGRVERMLLKKIKQHFELHVKTGEGTYRW